MSQTRLDAMNPLVRLEPVRLRVAQMIAEGYSNVAIGQDIRMTMATVYGYVADLVARYDVPAGINITERVLLAYAIRDDQEIWRGSIFQLAEEGKQK